MKKYISAVLTFLILTAGLLAGIQNSGKKPDARPDVSKAVSEEEEGTLVPATWFDGRKFYLAHTNGDAREWNSEYLLPEADLQSYTEMLAIRSYDGVKTTSRKVASVIISHFTKYHKGVPYDFLQGSRPGEWEISYTLYEPAWAEFHVFRIAPNGEHPVVFQYIHRAHLPSDTQAREQAVELFDKEVKGNSPDWLDALRLVRVPRYFRPGKK